MQKKLSHRILGMMSGTSLDGLDMVLAVFETKSGGVNWQILAATTIPYDLEMENRINQVYSGTARDLVSLDADLGKWMGQQALDFLQKNGGAELISSHGHTIFHDPAAGYTTQIGSGAMIAAITSLPVVTDLRSMDVAAGGQGAPLVPIGDELLFSEYTACLNLGGFSNISFRGAQGRTAFDICPVNFLLNRVAQLLGKPYDENGAWARSGSPIPELLDQLNALSFYHLMGPKSLAREQIETWYEPLLTHYYSRPYDLLSTLTLHISQQLLKVLNRHFSRQDKVLLSGGGALNQYLIELLKEQSQAQLVVADPLLLQFKEGLIFGLLGLLRVQNRPNSLPGVTGARFPVVGGALYGASGPGVEAE